MDDPTNLIVGYPGRDGAHSAAACEQLFRDAAELVALPSFAAVTQATADGSIDFGVLPIESSLAGPVADAIGLTEALWLAAILGTSSTLIGLTVRDVRSLRRREEETRLPEPALEGVR